MVRRWWTVLAVGCVALAGCGAAPSFPEGAAVDYQLGGPYPPPEGVGLVVRDATAAPAEGLYNVCYVNGFQTQPQERERWLREDPDLVLRTADGPLIDPGWPDELLLDTSTAPGRERIAERVGAVVAGCADAGYDAVEIDNLDSWTRSDGALTEADNLDLAARYVERAHAAGLLVGQKNTAELGTRGRELGFDFAVVEECVANDECAAFTDVYGERVLDVEYDTDPAEVCAAADRPRATVVRDRDLVPAGAPGHFYARC